MILGYEHLEVKMMIGYKTCRFGTWCYSVTDNNILNSEAYRKTEESHRTIHKLAVDAVEAYENKEIDKALQFYDQMKPYLKDMLDGLDALKSL